MTFLNSIILSSAPLRPCALRLSYSNRTMLCRYVPHIWRPNTIPGGFVRSFQSPRNERLKPQVPGRVVNLIGSRQWTSHRPTPQESSCGGQTQLVRPLSFYSEQKLVPSSSISSSSYGNTFLSYTKSRTGLETRLDSPLCSSYLSISYSALNIDFSLKNPLLLQTRSYSVGSGPPRGKKIRNGSQPQSGLKGKDKETAASSPGAAENGGEAMKNSGDEPAQLTLYQRFKKTYKEHGKILVAVHLLTSSIWFGSFYTAARLGVDIVPYLESWNFSEKVITPFRSGGLGDIALAYLLYKLATPARYTVTIGGTNLVIRYLRKGGKMTPIAERDTLSSMYNEGKADLKSKRDVRMRRMRARYHNSRFGRMRQRQKGNVKAKR